MTIWRVPESYTADQLVYAVRHAKAHPEDRYKTREGREMTAEQYLSWFRGRLHAKINRAGEGQERLRRGRKDGGDGYLSNYERHAMQVSRRVNTPRLIVRISEVAPEFRARLGNRLSRPEDF